MVRQGSAKALCVGSIPTLASNRNCTCSKDLRDEGSTTDTKTDTNSFTSSVTYPGTILHKVPHSLTLRSRPQHTIAIRERPMTTRYRLIRRGIRGGNFLPGQHHWKARQILSTSDATKPSRSCMTPRTRHSASQCHEPANCQSLFSRHRYGITTRTWQQAIEALTATKHGANPHRWQTAAKDKAFQIIRQRVIIKTQGEALLKVLNAGTVSTNVLLAQVAQFLPWT